MPRSVRIPRPAAPLDLIPVDLATLLALFEYDTITVTARAGIPIEDHPLLAVHMRGAIGRVLHALPPRIPPTRRAADQRPAAYWAVFEGEALTGGRNQAKPMIVATTTRDDLLIVQVRLVGSAAYWAPDVQDATVAAIEGGVQLWPGSRRELNAVVIDISHTRTGFVACSADKCSAASIAFHTPIRLRHEAATLFSPSSFLISLANRAVGLAAWQGLAPELEWSALHHAAHGVGADISDLVPFSWERGSVRQRRAIQVAGFLGKVRLSGDLAPFIPFLTLGELFNAGSHAALGLGRFTCAYYP